MVETICSAKLDNTSSETSTLGNFYLLDSVASPNETAGARPCSPLYRATLIVISNLRKAGDGYFVSLSELVLSVCGFEVWFGVVLLPLSVVRCNYNQSIEDDLLSIRNKDNILG